MSVGTEVCHAALLNRFGRGGCCGWSAIQGQNSLDGSS
jgi:hypothetical protein